MLSQNVKHVHTNAHNVKVIQNAPSVRTDLYYLMELALWVFFNNIVCSGYSLCNYSLITTIYDCYNNC